MILQRVKTNFCGKTQNITKQVYRLGRPSAHRFILGVYGWNTAKFYPCDKNGKRLSNKTLNFDLPFAGKGSNPECPAHPSYRSRWDFGYGVGEA